MINSHISTDFDKIWHGGANCSPNTIGYNKFEILKIQDGGETPS